MMAEGATNGAEQPTGDGHINYVESSPGLKGEDLGLARTYANRHQIYSDILTEAEKQGNESAVAEYTEKREDNSRDAKKHYQGLEGEYCEQAKLDLDEVEHGTKPIDPDQPDDDLPRAA